MGYPNLEGARRHRWNPRRHLQPLKVGAGAADECTMTNVISTATDYQVFTTSGLHTTSGLVHLTTMATAMTDGVLWCAPALRPAQPLRPRGLPRRRGTTLPPLAATVHARIITPFCGSLGRLYFVFIVKEWSTKKTMILFDINLNRHALT